jgi:hypothetical protein
MAQLPKLPKLPDRLTTWLLIGAVVGLLTGFGVGQTGDGSPDPTTPTTVPEEAAEEPPPETAPTTVVPQPSGLTCAGTVPPGTELARLVGVSDVGAVELSYALGLPDAVVRSFDELVETARFEEYRAAALQAAESGPVLLVVRLSSGARQKDLSQEVQAAAPGSVTVVVDPAGGPAVEALAEFAEPAVIVPFEPGAPPEWVQQVADLARGATFCPGPEG